MSKFTIDGKDWSYRDPNQNFNTGTTRRGRPGQYTGEDAFMDGYSKNSNAYSWSNPLYQYDRKTVEDAGKELGIQNVDEKREVKDILSYIEDSKKDEDKDEEKDKPVKEEPAEPPYTPTESEIKAEDFKQTRINELKESLAKPITNIYENYAGKDDLIARNKSQSEKSNSDDDDWAAAKGISEDWLDKYKFQPGQMIG